MTCPEIMLLCQVAGYQTRFKDARLSFVTIHSAGHEVPAYQPARAFKLLQKYLDGTWWNDDEKNTDAAYEKAKNTPAIAME